MLGRLIELLPKKWEKSEGEEQQQERNLIHKEQDYAIFSLWRIICYK